MVWRRWDHGWQRREVVAVTRTTSFATVAIDGRLQLARVTQLQLVALVRVQVLHVPEDEADDIKNNKGFKEWTAQRGVIDD